MIEGPEAEDDVRGPVSSGPIPDRHQDALRYAVKRTMRQLSGPYQPFSQYYPLDETIFLYDDIWNESSSDD